MRVRLGIHCGDLTSSWAGGGRPQHRGRPSSISGEPIIWTWIFWADGRQVAYETGPFHFGVTCFLVRLSDGRKLDSYDCCHDLPLAKPDWVKALEATK